MVYPMAKNPGPNPRMTAMIFAMRDFLFFEDSMWLGLIVYEVYSRDGSSHRNGITIGLAGEHSYEFCGTCAETMGFYSRVRNQKVEELLGEPIFDLTSI